MHDHSTRGKRFCPLMQEWCVKGWTPKMEKGPDGFPVEGACAAWQPVTTFDTKNGKTAEVFDCSIFGWTPDLLTEVAKEVQHGAASTDKVATQVAAHRKLFFTALPRPIQDRVMLSPPPAPPAEGPNGTS